MRNRRNGYIDLLKFVFAIFIVLMHSRVFCEKSSTFFPNAGLSVEFLFITTGAFMAEHIERLNTNVRSGGGIDETYKYLTHRLRLFYPQYCFTWVLGFIVSIIYWDKFTASKIINHFFDTISELLLFNMAGLGSTHVNGVSWFFSSMMIIMLVIYPFARKYYTTFSSAIAPFISIMTYGYIMVTFSKIVTVK